MLEPQEQAFLEYMEKKHNFDRACRKVSENWKASSFVALIKKFQHSPEMIECMMKEAFDEYTGGNPLTKKS